MKRLESRVIVGRFRSRMDSHERRCRNRRPAPTKGSCIDNPQLRNPISRLKNYAVLSKKSSSANETGRELVVLHRAVFPTNIDYVIADAHARFP